MAGKCEQCGEEFDGDFAELFCPPCISWNKFREAEERVMSERWEMIANPTACGWSLVALRGAEVSLMARVDSREIAESLAARLNAAQALVDAAREACRAHANYTKTCVAPLAGPTPGIASILLDRALAALSSALEPFRENKDGQ